MNVRAESALVRSRANVSARLWCARLHSWIGAFSALFLLLVALSGAALAFMAELFRWQYGDVIEADAPMAGATYRDIDSLIEAAVDGYGESFQPFGILMPHSRIDVSAAAVYGLPDGAESAENVMMLTVNPYTGDFLGAFVLDHAIGHWLAHFHFQLLAGPVGGTFVSILALLTIAFALTGLFLWWPRHGRTAWRKLRDFRLRPGAFGSMFRLHAIFGTWITVLIVFWSFSGVYITRPDWVSGVLPELPYEAPAEAREMLAEDCGIDLSPAQAVAGLAGQYPRKSPAMLDFMADGNYRVSLKGASDSNAYAGDVVAWANSRCAERWYIFDASTANLGTRAANVMFTWHGGRFLGFVGTFLTVLTGVVLAGMSVTGLYVWYVKTFGRRRREIQQD